MDFLSMGDDSSSKVLDLANQGQDLISSGQVSLKDAKAAQKKLGLDTKDGVQDAFHKVLGLSPQGASPYVFNPGGMPTPQLTPSALPTPPGMKAGAKGTQSKSQQTLTQDEGGKTTRNNFDQADDVMSMVRNTPEVRDQQQGLLDMAGQLAAMRAQKNNGDSWVKPLLALSDNINGGNMAQSFEPNSAKRNADISKFANELQQRKGDLSKQIIDGVTKLKTGQDQQSHDNKMQELLMMGIGGGSQNLATSREQMAAQRTMNNDPILKTYVPRLDGAVKILNLMQGARDGGFKQTGPVLAQLNAEIARLETGSQSPGLSAAEKTEMNDTAAKYHNIVDTLTGGVTGVNLEEKFKQAEGMVKDLGRSYQGHIHDRTQFLRSGSLPSQEEIFNAKQNQLESNYKGKFDVAAVAKKPGDIEDGMRYKGGDKHDPKNWEELNAGN